MLDKAFPIQDKLYDKIMRGECGDPNIEEDMKGMAKGIVLAIIRKQIPVILFFGKLFLGALKKKERERKNEKTIE